MKPHSFRNAPDFQADPVRGVARRVLWRLHWMFHPHRPILMRNWWRQMDIALPRSASAATVYYSRSSYAPMIQVMSDILHEGMVVLDIGAHAGEYALIAAGLMGDRGTVHAIEPQPELAEVIRNNVNRNRLSGVSVHAVAISDRTGSINFFFHPDSTGGWPAAAAVTTVPSFSLDDFVKRISGGSVDFIKLDAGGNELAVLRGGQETLRLLSPTILAKLYHPDVIRERHGYDPRATMDILRHHHYILELLDAPGPQARVALESFDQIAAYFQRTDIYNYDFCLLAAPHSSTGAGRSPRTI